MKVLQVKFKFKIPRSELEKEFVKVAPKFGPGGEVKGLLWKLWLVNEAESLFSGIYLFKDEASLKEYLKGELFAELKRLPIISDLETTIFDIMLEPTKITQGPIKY
ncbi:MAG: YdhR family protein [Candidatus Bathyarchaeia archaeon]|nr:YdhR family protein [Candidatus Bathyarchaeota archaeon]